MKVKNIIVVCDFANITGGAERVAVTSAVSLAETDSNVVMRSEEHTSELQSPC